MSQLNEETLLALLSQVRDGESTDGGGSLSPNDIAKTTNPENWRRDLPKIRAIAVGLARQGKVEILRKGKPADPEDLRGIYRLRLAK